MPCEHDVWICVCWKVTADPQKSGQINQECVFCGCIWCSHVILTASRRPDSVGVLSMSASNTSSAPVRTYNRTNRKENRNEKEKTFRWQRVIGSLLMIIIYGLLVSYLPLCGSSLRACLLGGELFWSLSGYNLFRVLLATQVEHSH